MTYGKKMFAIFGIPFVGRHFETSDFVLFVNQKSFLSGCTHLSQLSTLNRRFLICDVMLARRIASRIFLLSFAPKLSHLERRPVLSTQLSTAASSSSTPSASTRKKSSIFSTEPNSRVGKMSFLNESGLK
jgi:hypothetical protein